MAEYIERDKVMDALLHEQYGYLCEDSINSIPAADVVPVVRGKWVRHTDTRFGRKLNDCIECNCCGIWFSTENMIRRSFCPNCGADMRKEQT